MDRFIKRPDSITDCKTCQYRDWGELWICFSPNWQVSYTMRTLSSSIENNTPKCCWFVMRAYKCEKRAEEKLRECGIRFFIPKCYTIRVYHGVKSKRLVPAIPSLVFVYASRSELINFKKQYNFLQFVTRKQTADVDYLTVPDVQMENFIKIASHYEEDLVYLNPDEIDLKKGTKVRILGGKFDGVTGVFLRVQGKRNRRVVVQLEGITAIVAEVHPDLVEVVSCKV